uniref:Uncharacterized protein n=1 Tax=Gibberella zeae TaxID=5518 RepID=A0A4E9ELR5_GIBZA
MPARQRKQQGRAKQSKAAKPYGVTKPAPRPSPRVRSLRSRSRLGDRLPVSGASPPQAQITVAGDEDDDNDDEGEDGGEDDGEDDGVSVWDVPRSPAPRNTQRRGCRSVRSDKDKPVARFRNEVVSSVYANDPARVAERTDDHVGDDDEGDDYKQKCRVNARQVHDRNHRRPEFTDQGEPVEPSKNTASRHLGETREQGTAVPSASAEDGDAEGELWGEPTTPVAPMGMSGPIDDAVDMSYRDGAMSMNPATGMDDDAWMHSAIMDFGDMAGMPDVQQWGDVMEFDADDNGMHMDVDWDMGVDFMDQFGNGDLSIDMMGLTSAGPDVIPAVPFGAEAERDGDVGLMQGGGDIADIGADVDVGVDVDASVNASVDASVHTDAHTVTMVQPSATTPGGSRVPSTQSSDGALEVRARHHLDETHPGPRSTGVPGWLDTSERTTRAVKDREKSGRPSGNQLLAIIAKALSQMDSRGVAGPQISDKKYWSVESQDMIGMPSAMPAY